VTLRHSYLQQPRSKVANSTDLEQSIEVLQLDLGASLRSFDSAARSRAASEVGAFAAIWLSSISRSSSCSNMHSKLNSPFLSDAFCDLFPSMASRSQSEMCCVDRHIHSSTSAFVLVSTTKMSMLVSWRFLVA
jgi:hypothetical protein